MNELYKTLKEQEYEIQNKINTLDGQLRKAPKGSLKISAKGKYKSYYLYKSDDRGKYPYGRYLKKTEMDLVQRLAQKDYEKRVRQMLQKKLTAIKQLAKTVMKYDVANFYNELSNERKELICPIDVPDDLFKEQWMAETYDRMAIDEELYPFFTERGDHVRSKSEILIANRLFDCNIAYKYEVPLELESGITVHPDFAVLNECIRKVIYWEHFGRMDDEKYISNALSKISNYTKSGFVMGRDIIYTFESTKRPLDMRVVDELIKTIFLKQ